MSAGPAVGSDSRPVREHVCSVKAQMADHVVWDWNGTLWDDLPQVHQRHQRRPAGSGWGHPESPLEIRQPCSPAPCLPSIGEPWDGTSRRAEWERVQPALHGFLRGAVVHLARLAVGDQFPRSTWSPATAPPSRSCRCIRTTPCVSAWWSELGIGQVTSPASTACRGAPDRSKVGMFADHVRAAAPDISPHRVVMIGDTDDDLQSRPGGRERRDSHQPPRIPPTRRPHPRQLFRRWASRGPRQGGTADERRPWVRQSVPDPYRRSGRVDGVAFDLAACYPREQKPDRLTPAAHRDYQSIR